MPKVFPSQNLPMLVAVVLMALFQGISDLNAQTGVLPDSIRGTVLRSGQPVPDAAVTLHRVTPDNSGEVDSTTTSEDGSFAFPLEQLPDAEFNVFFVTAEYLSVRYFGAPIHLNETESNPYTVEVYDTASSLATSVRVNRRDVVLLPQTNDSWEVNEIISILNGNPQALVSRDGMPTLQISIPDGAEDFLAGEGADIFPHEVTYMDHRVMLLTPVVPGRRDLWIRYRLPSRPSEARVQFDQPTDTFNLYVQQPSHLTAVEGLASAQMIDVEGEQFLQYSGLDLPEGSWIDLRWTGGLPVDPVLLSVSVTIALLAVGAFLAVRNRAASYA